MKIIVRKRIPLKYLKDIVKQYDEGWNWDKKKGMPYFVYWASLWYSLTDVAGRRYNFVCLAIEPSGKCVAHLMARVASRHLDFHPILYLICMSAAFILSINSYGRRWLKDYKMYLNHMRLSVELGKNVLGGRSSEGVSVAVGTKHRKSGIYKEMTKKLFENINGCFIFHTSTESVYKAHEAMGYKHLYKVPLPYQISFKDEAYIMYGEKSILGAG